ncbi:hypothetical protein B0H11DRAFT_2211029 [Mycena galericulata]|nr:hypothetical protein B0H11DRAFT_2211029 [Mycena galericulata]
MAPSPEPKGSIADLKPNPQPGRKAHRGQIVEEIDGAQALRGRQEKVRGNTKKAIKNTHRVLYLMTRGDCTRTLTTSQTRRTTSCADTRFARVVPLIARASGFVGWRVLTKSASRIVSRVKALKRDHGVKEERGIEEAEGRRRGGCATLRRADGFDGGEHGGEDEEGGGKAGEGEMVVVREQEAFRTPTGCLDRTATGASSDFDKMPQLSGSTNVLKIESQDIKYSKKRVHSGSRNNE